MEAPVSEPQLDWSGNPYMTLGVSWDASVSHMRHQYRRLALVAHPDRCGSAAVFVALSRALEQLLSSRADCDAALSPAVPQAVSVALQLRPDHSGVVAVVSWLSSSLPHALYLRPPSSLSWSCCWSGLGSRVVVAGLAAGLYEAAVLCGGRPVVVSFVIEEAKPKTRRRRRKRTKKKAAQQQPSSHDDDGDSVPPSEVGFLLENVRCARCKTFVAVDAVESHEC